MNHSSGPEELSSFSLHLLKSLASWIRSDTEWGAYHANVQLQGCAAFWNLADNNENNKVMIADAGGIPSILSAMRTHSSNARVQEHGCGALWKLALNNGSNKVTISDAG